MKTRKFLSLLLALTLAAGLVVMPAATGADAPVYAGPVVTDVRPDGTAASLIADIELGRNVDMSNHEFLIIEMRFSHAAILQNFTQAWAVVASGGGSFDDENLRLQAMGGRNASVRALPVNQWVDVWFPLTESYAGGSNPGVCDLSAINNIRLQFLYNSAGALPTGARVEAQNFRLSDDNGVELDDLLFMAGNEDSSGVMWGGGNLPSYAGREWVYRDAWQSAMGQPFPDLFNDGNRLCVYTLNRPLDDLLAKLLYNDEGIDTSPYAGGFIAIDIYVSDRNARNNLERGRFNLNDVENWWFINPEDFGESENGWTTLYARYDGFDGVVEDHGRMTSMASFKTVRIDFWPEEGTAVPAGTKIAFANLRFTMNGPPEPEIPDIDIDPDDDIDNQALLDAAVEAGFMSAGGIGDSMRLEELYRTAARTRAITASPHGLADIDRIQARMQEEFGWGAPANRWERYIDYLWNQNIISEYDWQDYYWFYSVLNNKRITLGELVGILVSLDNEFKADTIAESIALMVEAGVLDKSDASAGVDRGETAAALMKMIYPQLRGGDSDPDPDEDPDIGTGEEDDPEEDEEDPDEG
jgi:hypothetical protein